jgi:hypothetical protein
MRLKKLFLITLNAVVIVTLGICYLQLLKLFIAHLYPLVNEPASTFVKIAHTGSSAALAMAVIFSVNAFITQQNMLRLGQACGVAAFIWFYVVRAEGQSTIGLIFASFMVAYSLFALVAFTLGPVAIGYFLNKRKPLDGFLSACHRG